MDSLWAFQAVAVDVQQLARRHIRFAPFSVQDPGHCQDQGRNEIMSVERAGDEDRL